MILLIFEMRLILEIPGTTVLAKMIKNIFSANCTASSLSIAKKIEMSFIQTISNQLNPLEMSSIFCLFYGSKPQCSTILLNFNDLPKFYLNFLHILNISMCLLFVCPR